MKITIEKQPAITEEIEVTFPTYRCNNDAFYYKLNSDDSCLSVMDLSHVFSIEHRDYVVYDSAFGSKSREITKEEFDAKFNEILIKINNLI